MNDRQIKGGFVYEITNASADCWYVIRTPVTQGPEGLQHIGPFASLDEAAAYRDSWIEVTSRVRHGRKRGGRSKPG